MAKCKQSNIQDLIDTYNEDYIKSISLNNIKNVKELKSLLTELEKANNIVTQYYELLYIDFIMSINSDNQNYVDIDNLIKYKNIANKIQKAYNYIMYLNMFNNPFKKAKWGW